MKKYIITFTLFCVLIAILARQAWAVTSYEIYTMQPGDTRENIALRQGITLNDIVSIDDGPWIAGKRVAILRRYSAQPTIAVDPQPTSTVSNTAPRLGTVARSGCQITSQPSGGKFLFQPDQGSKLVVIAETPLNYGCVMADRSTGWIKRDDIVIDGPIDSAWLQKILSGGQTQVVDEAFRYLGLPYRYGGHLPYNTDCSLLVQKAFSSQGINLPRTAAQQSQVGIAVNLSEIQPGDRLYFINSKGIIGHTGLYIGSGFFIHASSNRGYVAVDKLAGSYLRKLVGIRR